MKTALTDVMLRKFKPTGKRVEISDATTPGLRARISATGQITFILKSKNAMNQLKTVTLGGYPDMPLKQAREAAIKSRIALKAGEDVNSAKKLLRHPASSPPEPLSLRALICEFEERFASEKKSWRPRGPRSFKGAARLVIERVYADLLDRDVTSITEEEFASVSLSYKRVIPTEQKQTANGQVSRARSYLGPVLDWSAGRKRYAKIGASRSPKLDVVSLANTHDPATDDPTITGKRIRTLSEVELYKLLPLLTYPAPEIGQLKLDGRLDFRPIAMRFLLFTAARLEEVCSMRWGDVDWENKVWRKPEVKSTKGGPRGQSLPLSDAAMTILDLVRPQTAIQPEAFVFPNGNGQGRLRNWGRYQKALHEATGTSDWHRHDLRRTSATIMYSLKVSPSTIAQILAHKDPLRSENLGGAASNYLQLTRVLQASRDPQEEALTTLADAFKLIENRNRNVC